MYIHVPIRLQEPDGFLGPHCRGNDKESTEFGDRTKSFESPTHL